MRELFDYEKQLIEGLTNQQKEDLIKSVNRINKAIGLKPFGSD